MKEKIAFWPAWFLDSLPEKDKRRLKPAILKQLKLSQIYLWRALNIYDDFWDGAGQAKKLNLANSYQRRYFKIIYSLGLARDYHYLFDRVWTALEKANQAEMAQPRLKIMEGKIFFPGRWPEFKKLENLSRKSLVLALAPLAIMYLQEKPPNRKRVLGALNFFRFALAAKQLADDAQDWLSDLKSGALTSVNLLLLKKAKRGGLSLDWKRRPEVLDQLFVREASLKISQQLMDLCAQARQAAWQAAWKNNCSLIREIIEPLENGVKEVEKFRSLLAKKPKKMI